MNIQPMHSEPRDAFHAHTEIPADFVQPMFTILLMSGKEDGGKRATLAFVAAVSAAAMGRPVQVFMAGDGAVWGDPQQAENVEMAGFPSLAALIREYLDLDGALLVCSTCERFCMRPGTLASGNRWPSLEARGMAALLESQGDGHSLSF
jgi:predicted peroxiredoxin